HSHLPQPPTVFSPSTMKRNIGRRTFSHIHFAPAWMPAQAGLMALFHSHFAAAPIAWKAGRRTAFHSQRPSAAMPSKAGFNAFCHSHLPTHARTLNPATIGATTTTTMIVARIFAAVATNPNVGLRIVFHTHRAALPIIFQ